MTANDSSTALAEASGRALRLWRLPAVTDRSALPIAAATAIVLALIRIPLLGLMHRPGVLWDEMTYLSFARYFGGAGALLDFRVDTNVEHAGYGLIIAPAFAARPPFELAYHFALVINLILSACVTFLSYVIARRVAGASWPVALASAIAVTAYPAFFLIPLFVMSENLVYPLALLSILALYELIERPAHIGWHLVFALSLVGIWFAHGAAVVFVGAGFATVAFLAQQRRIRLPLACMDAAIFIAGFILIGAVHQHLWQLSDWGSKGDGADLARYESDISVRGLTDAIRLFCYEQTAVLLPTMGAYGLALGVVVREIWTARKTARSSRSLVCIYVLLAALGFALMSPAFLSSEVPNWHDYPDTTYCTRYVEEGLLGLLAVGLPLFFSQRLKLRPFVYCTVAAIAILACIAATDHQGAWYIARRPWLNDFGWGAVGRLLGGASTYVIGAFAAVIAAIVIALQRRWNSGGLLVLAAVWFAASEYSAYGQIGPWEQDMDVGIRDTTSLIAPYFRLLPQDADVAYDADNLNILSYTLESLAVTNHRFLLTHWRSGGAPAEDAAVATAATAPTGYAKIACENYPPAECLYVRDPLAASYLQRLARHDTFRHPLVLGAGIDLAIGSTDYGDYATWTGLSGHEQGADGAAFRWTDGDARVALPPLDTAAKSATIEFLAPNAGLLTIEIERPGSKTEVLNHSHYVAGLNSYQIPLAPYAAGTEVSVRTTGRPVVNPGDPRQLSVQLRQFRLVP